MTQPLDPHEAELLARSKQAMDRSLDDLDPHTLARLRLARRRALEAAPRSKAWLVWAGGFAMASVAILALVLWLKPPAMQQPNHQPALEDLELITSLENVELSEDLEFYGWLAETPSAG
ncbi:MAG: hypothetical protein ACT4OO_08695 [Nitrospiraceae bacterium]